MSDSQRLAALDETLEGIGDRLREERVNAGISQRELARRLGLSASMISQVESGMSKPSVGTLYAIVTELNVSLDQVIRGQDFTATQPVTQTTGSDLGPVVHPDQRQVIELDSGVRWEDLTASPEDEIHFLQAIYEVGGASTPDRSLMRHHGREYGYVMSGTLGIQIEFEDFTLEPGDSIAFDSTRPHRLYNKGEEPVRAIWFVVGRGADERVHDS